MPDKFLVTSEINGTELLRSMALRGKDAGGTTCIPSGPGRNCTGRGTRRKSLTRFWVKTWKKVLDFYTCGRYMIRR